MQTYFAIAHIHCSVRHAQLQHILVLPHGFVYEICMYGMYISIYTYVNRQAGSCETNMNTRLNARIFALCEAKDNLRCVAAQSVTELFLFFYETFKIFTSPSRLDSKELRHGQINYKKHVHKCLSVEKEKSGHKLLRVFESTKCLKCNLSKYKLVKCIKNFLGCRNAFSKILALIIAKLKVI